MSGIKTKISSVTFNDAEGNPITLTGDQAKAFALGFESWLSDRGIMLTDESDPLKYKLIQYKCICEADVTKVAEPYDDPPCEDVSCIPDRTTT